MAASGVLGLHRLVDRHAVLRLRATLWRRERHRRLEPVLTLLERLEADLRRDPWDAATSLVWADSLSQASDPRGELIALEHAIRAAAPEEALDLAERQMELWLKHRAALMGKPGGFPFREPYVGRQVIRVFVHGPLLREPEGLFDRALRFATRLTDASGPFVVHSYRRADLLSMWTFGRRSEPETDVEHELLRLLAPAHLHRAMDGRAYVQRENRGAPLPDDDALRALLTRILPITIAWSFGLTHPDTDVLLPHQDGELYGHHAPSLPCTLQIASSGLAGTRPMWSDLWLDAYLPFEDLADPAFIAYLGEITDTLGVEITQNSFNVLEPKLDGSGLVVTKETASRFFLTKTGSAPMSRSVPNVQSCDRAQVESGHARERDDDQERG
jgi:hypothetical protein